MHSWHGFEVGPDIGLDVFSGHHWEPCMIPIQRSTWRRDASSPCIFMLGLNILHIFRFSLEAGVIDGYRTNKLMFECSANLAVFRQPLAVDAASHNS